jgi:hypothetical protein
MKKTIYLKGLLLALAIGLSYLTEAQVLITSLADSTAVLGESYTYDVDVVTIPPGAPVTYTLEEKPSGMTINATTGVISWVPASIYDGGKVVVKATKSASETSIQTFHAYVTDAIACHPGIISYWSFDSKQETTIPDMAADNDALFVGIASNEPTLINGRVGLSGIFDPQSSASSYYEVTDQDQFDWKYNEAFTLSLWFKNKPSVLTPKSSETFLGRASSAGSFASWTFQWLPSSNKIGFFLQSSNGIDTVALNNNTIADTNWHHAAVVVVGSQTGATRIAVYLDNTRSTTFKTYGTTRFDNVTPVTIGHWDEWTPTNYPFSGNMDEVAIFGNGLTDAEISQLYNKGLNNTPVCQDGNFTPIITSAPLATVQEDAAYSYTLIARDYETSGLTKSVVEKPDWLNFNTSTGELSGTPGNDNVGDATVTLRVSDGLVDVDQTFTLTVENVNNAPEVTSTPELAVQEDVIYTYTFTAEDIDASEILTLSAPLLPSWLAFNASTGVLSGTPTNAQVGLNATATFDVTLRATDLALANTDQQFTITVSNVNDAPVINSQNALSTDEDENLVISVSDLVVSDVDNAFPDDFTLTVKDGSNYTHTGNTVTPAQDWNGRLTVPVDLSDGTATVSFDLSVQVNEVDDPPVFTSTPVLIITAGSNYEYWITSEDAEDQILTITSPTKPAWLTLSANNGTGLLSGTPTGANAGDVNIVLQVTDGTTIVEQPFTITVSPNTAVNNVKNEFAKVYPIPASEFVRFEFAEKLGKATLEIFTSNGSIIRKIDVSNLNHYQLPVLDFKPNQYIFRISSSGKVQSGYIVVE